jgi:hypothetical protein
MQLISDASIKDHLTRRKFVARDRSIGGGRCFLDRSGEVVESVKSSGR